MSGWTTKKLGEVCETITDGDHQPPPKVASGVPFLVISDVSKGRLSFEDTRFVPEEYYAKIPEAKKPKIGDVLLTVTGSFGIPVLVDVEKRFCFQRHIALLRSNQLVPRFLVYQLSSHESFKYFDKVATGTAQRTVSLSSLRNMEIVVPPLAEQKRIVTKIDAAFAKIDALKANAEKNLANAKELFQSALDEAMRPKPGWVEKRLGEVCDTITARGHQIQQKEIAESGKYPVVSQSEKFIEGYTDFNDPVKSVPVILFGDHTCCSKYIDFPFVVGADGTKLLKVNQGYAKYWYYVILKIGMSLVDGKYRRHFKDLKKAGVHLPPMNEQQWLAKQLDSLSQKTETLQQNYARQIADCAEMRQAILREAFEGRL